MFLRNGFDGRAILLWVLVVIWAVRLGTFLFQRIRKAGKDDRFDELKPSFIRSLNVWTIQGLWVTFTMAAALVAITTANHKKLDLFAIVGFRVWVLGFTIRALGGCSADRPARSTRRQWVALISPVLVALLLTRVSGVPLLEKKADQKWGGQADYEAYKKNVPVLIARL